MKKFSILVLIIFLSACTTKQEEKKQENSANPQSVVQTITQKKKVEVEDIKQIHHSIYDNPEQIITLYIEYVLDKKWKISRIQVGSQNLDREIISEFDEAIKKAVTWLSLKDIETVSIETESSYLATAFKETIRQEY